MLFINTAGYSIAHAKNNLQFVRDQMLEFLIHEQFQDENLNDTYAPIYFKGEWPNYMQNLDRMLLLGPQGKTALDSNLFVSSSILVAITKIALTNPDYFHERFPEIDKVIEHGLESFQRYQDNLKPRKKNQVTSSPLVYTFWPLLPRSQHLPSNNGKVIMVRRPTNYVLKSDFINNAANVPADADDTAMGYLARHLAHLWNSSLFSRPENNFSEIFDLYRDKNRRSLHYYNAVHGFKLFTGAYLTWFDREPFFTPISWLPIHKGKSYIPYGANEVDCVVNSNILYSASVTGQLNDLKGQDDACDFINDATKHVRRIQMCGLYYPTAFHFPYAYARAISSGVTCLGKHKNRVIDYVMASQKDDGSFTAHPRGQRWKGALLGGINSFEKNEKRSKDIEEKEKKQIVELNEAEISEQESIQSTVYALGTLINLDSKLTEASVKMAFQKGIEFVISKVKQNHRKQMYIEGGTFFAGGTLVRGSLSWKSPSYTTAIFAQILTEYLKIDQLQNN